MQNIRIGNVEINDIKITQDPTGKNRYSISYRKITAADRARQTLAAPRKLLGKTWNKITNMAIIAFIIGLAAGIILTM